MNVTMVINGVDYSPILSTFECYQTRPQNKVITTLDGNERQFPGKAKSVMTISFWPMTKDELFALYEILKNNTAVITYTNPYFEYDVTQSMRVDGDISSKFALLSVDGHNRYKGLSLTFRQM